MELLICIVHSQIIDMSNSMLEGGRVEMDNEEELKKILEVIEFRIKNLEHRVQKIEDSARKHSIS
jgi:hypothetical protein